MYYLTDEDYKTAESNGIDKYRADKRFYDLGWTVERTITQPVRKQRKARFHKERERAVENGISKNVFNARIHDGWDAEDASIIPVMTVEEKTKKAGSAKAKYTEYRNRAHAIGISNRTFDGRIYRGWTPEEACSIPPFGKGGRRKGKENKKENTHFNNFKGAVNV